jgi:hypothetical protein
VECRFAKLTPTGRARGTHRRVVSSNGRSGPGSPPGTTTRARLSGPRPPTRSSIPSPATASASTTQDTKQRSSAAAAGLPQGTGGCGSVGLGRTNGRRRPSRLTVDRSRRSDPGHYVSAWRTATGADTRTVRKRARRTPGMWALSATTAKPSPTRGWAVTISRSGRTTTPKATDPATTAVAREDPLGRPTMETALGALADPTRLVGCSSRAAATRRGRRARGGRRPP